MKSGDEKHDARLIATNGSHFNDVAQISASGDGGVPALGAHRFAVAEHGPVDDAQYRAALELEGSAHGGESVSLYVHLPFCPSRCLTCDQHSTVTHDSREVDRYIDTLEREVSLVAAPLGDRRRLQQLHLGGGTPNYLSDVQLARLLDVIERHFVIDDNTDASLEANAQRASHSQLSLLHGLGFRGINLEIRDLDEHVQRALGRSQSLPVIRDVVDGARDIGFTRVGTDLVYGLPRQSPSSMDRTLQELLSLDPDRIACSAFSRRQGRFEHQRAIDCAELPSLADTIAMFARIVDALSGKNYDWIGLDCFARPSDPISLAQVGGVLHRNWIGYTAQDGRRVLGVGNSSVSDLTGIRVRNHTAVDQWRASIERGELPVAEGELLSTEQRAQRYALSDLMCNMHSRDLGPLFGDADGNPALEALVDDGLLTRQDDEVTVTEQGRFMLHRIWGDSSPSGRWAYAV